jgi:hypothetical protein
MNPAPSWVLIPELGLAFGNHPMAFQGELTGELLFFSKINGTVGIVS